MPNPDSGLRAIARAARSYAGWRGPEGARLLQIRRRLNDDALLWLQTKPLWPLVCAYRDASSTSGADYWDYAYLYRLVRELKPREVLECGTGITTVVIAAALKENREESGISGHMTSMEQDPSWFEMADAALPRSLREDTEIVLARAVEFTYGPFRGVGYENVPQRPYEFVWIDGPHAELPDEGTISFGFDFINVLRRSERPIRGLIDFRQMTAFVLQMLLGPRLVRLDTVTELVEVGPCRASDLVGFEVSASGEGNRHILATLRRQPSTTAMSSFGKLQDRAVAFGTRPDEG